jgi:hypothetical protein
MKKSPKEGTEIDWSKPKVEKQGIKYRPENSLTGLEVSGFPEISTSIIVAKEKT